MYYFWVLYMRGELTPIKLNDKLNIKNNWLIEFSKKNYVFRIMILFILTYSEVIFMIFSILLFICNLAIAK